MTELRPLSIPTLYDRAQQALVKQALEAEWEAKFEPNSYGFRPGRAVREAIGATFTAIKTHPKYGLDADVAKGCDRIEQTTLLRKLQTFPRLTRPIWRWLKAGGWIMARARLPSRVQGRALFSKVHGIASPFNGDWRYWAARRGTPPGISRRVATLLHTQHGRCGYCALVFLPEALLEVHHRNPRRGDNSYRNLGAVHRHCHDQIHGNRRDCPHWDGTYDKSRTA